MYCVVPDEIHEPYVTNGFVRIRRRGGDGRTWMSDLHLYLHNWFIGMSAWLIMLVTLLSIPLSE